MKKIGVVIVVCIIILTCVLCGLVDKKDQNPTPDIARFHIRANSNSAADQYIKYLVKDKIVELINPMLVRLNCSADAFLFMLQSQSIIEEYVNFILKKQNQCYKATVRVGKQYFDEKELNGVVYPAGKYNSVIVELGEAKGNNWWGLIYPSLSYIPISGSCNDYNQIIYKSKIQEICNNIAN